MDGYFNYYTVRAIADGRTQAKTLARGNSKLGADYLNALQRGRALALEKLYHELARPEN